VKKTAFLFPGQGSQYVGMGSDLYQEYDEVRELFDMVEEIARINISKLCFKGPLEDLTETVNLQPAITAVNLACFTAIHKEGTHFDITAGHSLGEYSAMNASGVVSKEDTFKLVFKRGELMHRESTQHKGAMQAIIGLPIDTVKELVTDVKKEGVVSVANHNAEKQIVITGAPDPVKKVSVLAKSHGAKAIPLKVSGAWHSELIKAAQEEFSSFIDEIHFNTPDRQVISNVTAEFVEDVDEIKSLLVKQLCSPVKWYDSMRKLMSEHIEIFVEIGPGKVLIGLLKKIMPKDYPGKLYNVNDLKSLERFFNETS
jgi:[acyl-carrier-protein] S-malonyltransferase